MKITIVEIYNSMDTLKSVLDTAGESYYTGKLTKGNFSERSTER